MIKINLTNERKDKSVKLRKKGNSYEARKTIDLSKIYGFEMKKRISKTALTEEKAIALLNEKEQEEILDAVEDVKKNRYLNKDEYERLEKNILRTGNDFTIKFFVETMLNEKKLQSEIDFQNRRKRISHKTLTSYINTAKKQVLPYFSDIDIRKIKLNDLQEHFDNLDYSEKYLKDIKLILKMTFEKAVEIGILNDNIAKKIYIGSRKYNKGIEIEHLSKERQKVWLDLFEEDGRMWSYLFETMLLSGIRPEEACSLKFKSIDINKDMIYIREAYKDVIVYDNELNKKMHKRILGDLKTKQSYRDIPLNPRLKKLIIRIKEDRILYYKKIGKKLNEDEFIFLNQKGEPYVSEMLTNKMPAFIKKYNLEHMTVYRTST